MKTPLFRRALLVLAGVTLLAGPARAGVSFGVDIGGGPPPPPPPAPPVVQYAAPGPGSVWIDGHWAWGRGGRWVWWPGYWDYPPQDGSVWLPGGIVIIGGHYYYRHGYWGRGNRGYYGGGRGGGGYGGGRGGGYGGGRGGDGRGH